MSTCRLSYEQTARKTSLLYVLGPFALHTPGFGFSAANSIRRMIQVPANVLFSRYTPAHNAQITIFQCEVSLSQDHEIRGL